MPKISVLFSGALLVALTGCASTQWTYVAPPGVPDSRLRADQAACVEESSIQRLREDQIILEQRCMMAQGYTIKEKP